MTKYTLSYTLKVGFMTLGDHRPDMWEKVFSKLAQPLHKKARGILRFVE